MSLYSEGSPFILAGLGNPGEKYVGTRHNLGFDVIAALCQKWRISKFAKKFHSLYALTEFEGKKVLLLMPQTYMNLSGQAVNEALHFYKTNPQENLLVINDDLDLPAGQIRMRLSGGAGGHNGLSSIIEHLSSEEFPRLRIGIGRNDTVPTENYVLQKIPKSEKDIFETALIKCVEGIESILKNGFSKAMNQINKKAENGT